MRQGARPATTSLLAALAAVAALVAGGCGNRPIRSARERGQPAPATSTSSSVPSEVPPGGRGLLGAVLTGVGAHLKPPLNASYQPYSPDCHQLVDPGFSGKCTVAASPEGTVAGIVEVESAVTSGLRQERDLVWRRAGRRWRLAEVHVTEVCLNGLKCGASPGLPALVWRDDLRRDGHADLVFVLPSDQAGFGTELDVVAGDGRVTLYRDLGDGFAVAAPLSGLVAYAPTASEAVPAGSYFDQVLIRFEAGHWRLISDQYVPYQDAMAQHRGAFFDPQAVPAAS
ncbi:MAG TPA: hypothetical protein VK425_12445 [Acidimicrobiales bacterium]|nr:hypothetical protein [Acidimicrobiales bacterium]